MLTNEHELKSWLRRILDRERRCHFKFFGKVFDLSKLKRTLERYGWQQIQEWQKSALEPHCFPKISMMVNDDFPGWKIRPQEDFYERVAKGEVLRNFNGKLLPIKIELEGVIALVDTRLKPNYDRGRQMFKNDNLLGPIIAQLRRKRKISEAINIPQDSRFRISPINDWERQVKPLLAKNYGFKVNQIILEPAIVANVVPQLYPYMSRRDDGKTDTYMWYEEFCYGFTHRYRGGSSAQGGLRYLSPDFTETSGDNQCIRPFIVLEFEA